MSDEPRPLNVRCAEALGVEAHPECWLRFATEFQDETIWAKNSRYCTHGPACVPELPPFGENTPKGWACTGPLIERFVLNIGCDHARWYVFRDTHATGAHGSASTAIAEWVARYVKNGEVV